MARRGRKKHVQELLFRHGGRRKGAGRKPNGARAGAAHKKRPELAGTEALHVVLRVADGVGSLREPAIYGAIQRATRTAKLRRQFRIVQLSIQQTHVHLLVEADDKAALATGMQGFQISATRNINAVLGAGGARRRRGKVFADRYHLVVIESPTQARRVLEYVMCNWRKHHEDRVRERRGWMVDAYSSGRSFLHWQEFERSCVVTPALPSYGALEVSARERGYCRRAGGSPDRSARTRCLDQRREADDSREG
jgi:REP element-mobilizing transposase RayT